MKYLRSNILFLAYVLPAITHIIAQHDNRSNSYGPIVLIVVPTRELGIQVRLIIERCI